MEITLMLIWYILILHWLMDFGFQTENMAIKKSTNARWLALHSFEYSLGGLCLCYDWSISLIIVLYLFATHFIVDGITSHLTSYYKEIGDNKMYFRVLGADQMIHIFLLFLYFINFC